MTLSLYTERSTENLKNELRLNLLKFILFLFGHDCAVTYVRDFRCEGEPEVPIDPGL